MIQPVLITTPIPTPEELADQLGVSRERLREIRAIMLGTGSKTASASARALTRKPAVKKPSRKK